MKDNSTPDPRVVYAEIIDLPHWESPSRPRMSRYNRAAQFSPFAALTGYEDVIEETGRLTERCVELDEGSIAQINSQLQKLLAVIHTQPVATVVYFQPDPLKDGGSYETKTGQIRAISTVFQNLEFTDRTQIDFEQITAIHMPE